MRPKFHWGDKVYEARLQAAPTETERFWFAWTQGLWFSIMWPIRVVQAFIAVLFTARVAKDHDIIAFLHNTPSLMIMVNKGTRGKYAFRVPVCHLEFQKGIPMKSFELEYDEAKIYSFQLNGSAVTDRRLMMSVVFNYCQASSHTKVHVLSCTMMNLLKSNPNDPVLGQLLPEIEINTEGLHNTLLTSVFSPLNPTHQWLHFHTATLDSGAVESENWTAFSHSGLSVLHTSKLAIYLTQVRAILKQELEVIGVKDNPRLTDLVFSQSVLHSLDHYLCHKYSKPFVLSISMRGSEQGRFVWAFWDRLRAEIFKRQFSQPTVAPTRWASNLLRHAKSPFWSRVHHQVRRLDLEGALHITEVENYFSCSVNY